MDHRVLREFKALGSSSLDELYLNGRPNVKPERLQRANIFSDILIFMKNCDKISKSQIFLFWLIEWNNLLQKDSYVSQWLGVHYRVLGLKKRQKNKFPQLSSTAVAGPDCLVVLNSTQSHFCRVFFFSFKWLLLIHLYSNGDSEVNKCIYSFSLEKQSNFPSVCTCVCGLLIFFVFEKYICCRFKSGKFYTLL